LTAPKKAAAAAAKGAAATGSTAKGTTGKGENAPKRRKVRRRRDRRGRRQRRKDDVVAPTERFWALLLNEDLYRLAALLRQPNPNGMGSPNHYPMWVYLLYGGLIGVYGSAETVGAQLRLRGVWREVRALAAEIGGPDAVAGLPTRGPERHHWNYWSRQIADQMDEVLRPAFKELAVAQAFEAGAFPDQPRSLVTPARANTITGDGKVGKSPCSSGSVSYNDPETGERITRRIDHDAHEWTQGGDDRAVVVGTKFVHVSVRTGSDWHTRVVLDLANLPKGYEGGEMGLGMEMIRDVHDKVGDRLHLVSWDGAMRGKHVSELMDRNLLAYSNLTAKKVHNDGTREEQEMHLMDKVSRHDGGSCRHEIWSYGGRAHDVVVDDVGNQVRDPLPILRLLPNRGETRTRWYHEVAIPCEHGEHADGPDGIGRYHRELIRLSRSTEELRNSINRAESMRQLPPNTPGGDTAKGYRQDSESLNAQAENSWYSERLPAWGAPRQTLIMFLFAFMHNSVSRYLHRGRPYPGDPPGLDA
jgi:hypothetical protein